MNSAYSSVPLSRMRVGTILRAPIYDANSRQEVLLLAAGAKLTTSRLENLRRRGITAVRVHSRDLQSGTTQVQPQPESEDRSAGSINISKNSFLHAVKDHGTANFEAQRLETMAGSYAEAGKDVKDLFSAMVAESGVDGSVAVHVTTAALEELAEDLDLFVMLSIDKETEGKRYKHSLRTSRLAMAIATVMGLTRARLLDLGVGCLIHDVGMSKVDAQLLERTDAINRIDFLDIMKHPIYTYDMLENLHQIPAGARMVAYQIHERWDGSGYPRGRRGSQIHPLARIGAVADVFSAMTAERPHRSAFSACGAMVQILRDANQGLFEPDAVQGLLRAVSLFPIGSVIEVSDGRVGKVVRANHENFDRPIVELWASGDFRKPGEIADLSEKPHLSVVRSIANAPGRSAPVSPVEVPATPRKRGLQMN